MYYRRTVLLGAIFLLACTSQKATAQDKTDLTSNSPAHSSLSSHEDKLRIKYTSEIRCIFEDSKGRFWFGSHQEGVCVLTDAEFKYYKQSDGLSNNQVRTIQEDRAGVIWFGTGNGVTSFDGNAFTIRDRSHDLTPTTVGKKFWSLSADDLWFPGDSRTPRDFNRLAINGQGSDGQGVYQYDGQNLSYLAFPLPKDLPKERNPQTSWLVTSITKGRDGTIWFGTYPGVIKYNGRDFAFITNQTVGEASSSGELHVRSVFEDSKGNIWIGNNGIGVVLFDGSSFSNFTDQHRLSIKEKGAANALARVFVIAEDANGSIWFGTSESGAWRFDGDSVTNFTTKDGLTTQGVWSIYRDRRDNLWFGMSNGSVCRFNGKSFDRIY